ncbi:MAG TPA: DUF4276 family protein, partial [Burkholderiaceae bacterium]|nr:DUF4276 family protein [Burkholderiaceae bacterium]
SMKVLLDGLLPRLFPGMAPGLQFLCVPHQGKSDLDASIPKKLASWRIPDDRFVVVRDNDNANCTQIKARYIQWCQAARRPDTLIRLVCQELESWYLGDLTALALAFENPKLNTPALRKRYADPDRWQKPSVELERLIPEFQKGSGARAMAEVLAEGPNTSASFRAFVSGVRRLAADMGYVS